ncbi:MAG: hypothetical protein Q4B05_02220 [Candidatus Saccharibacteria bacterium]|nr:hypothetical protein [Candidatus Saccharibacteria bacterium]
MTVTTGEVPVINGADKEAGWDALFSGTRTTSWRLGEHAVQETLPGVNTALQEALGQSPLFEDETERP